MNIAIYGTGGYSSVVYELCQELGFSVQFFIDDSKYNTTFKELDVISFEKFLSLFLKDNINVCIAVGNNNIRKDIYDKLKSYNINMPTLIHPSANISYSSNIGEATIISRSVVISSNTNIGNCVILNTGSIVEHDCCIDDFSHLSTGVVIGSNSNIGKSCYFDIGTKVDRLLCISDNTNTFIGEVLKKENFEN